MDASPSQSHLQRSIGRCAVSFKAESGVTRLDRLYQSPPCRVLFPYPEPDDIPTAVVVTTSGGLAGGDEILIEAAAGPGTRALITAQAAEKIYRSTGADTRMVVTLTAGEGAWLEWLPQETILFDGARLRRRTEVHLAAGARVMAGEFQVFGRLARGETFQTGLLHDALEVRRCGRLVWKDVMRLDEEIPAVLDDTAGFSGSRACFTFLYAAEDAPAHLDFVRACLSHSPCTAGATIAGETLIARFLAPSPLIVRRAVTRLWTAFRHAVGGVPATLPRLWYV